VYSLVSSAVLALDLARHPSGAAVAHAVDRVLALTDHELQRMQQPASGGARARVLAAVAHQPRMSALMGGVAATVADGLPKPTRTILTTLNETLLGGLEDLHRMLRVELQAPEPAVQVALDGVTVAWAGRHAALDDLTALNTPWVQALDPVAPALPQTVYSGALSLLLDEISRRTPAQWLRVAAAHGALRGRRAWSNAMHRACQGAFEADRLTDTARAQLAAARVLRLSGASTGEDAHALGMAVTAAVQATCTADLLDGDTATVLMHAWSAGS
jgi:hypothetical protein